MIFQNLFKPRRRMLAEIPAHPELLRLIDAYGNAKLMQGYALHIDSRIGERSWQSRAIDAKKDLLEAIESLA